MSEQLIIFKQLWVHLFNVSDVRSAQGHFKGNILYILADWAQMIFIAAADREFSFHLKHDESYW